MAHKETDEGFTPLLVAAKNGDEETFSVLLHHVLQLMVGKISYHACNRLAAVNCEYCGCGILSAY